MLVKGTHLADEPFEGDNIAGHLVLVAVPHGADTTGKAYGHGAPVVPDRLPEGPARTYRLSVGVVEDVGGARLALDMVKLILKLVRLAASHIRSVGGSVGHDEWICVRR